MKSKKRRIILTIICVLILLLLIGYYALCVSIYNENFNKRFESYEPYLLYTDDYEDLTREQYRFPSDKGQMLTGYLYRAGEEDPRGIVILAHGLGAGHNSYMSCADHFTQHGYLVFAYDATGNDESEGEGVGGIPQGVIDLDHAISYVEESGEFPALPIVLFGHSWGGYSGCSVLNYHPEVKAVIEVSGCNRSSDLFEAGGKAQAGDVIYTMMPFIRLHERIRYGKYAGATAMGGFAASDAAVMAVHSADDEVVPIGYGFDRYYAAYKDDPRFTFLRLEDRGHNYVFDNRDYINEFNAGFDEWLETLEYDYNAPENKDRFIADKAGYIHANLDRTRWSHMLDTSLFDTFLAFYDAHLSD